MRGLSSGIGVGRVIRESFAFDGVNEGSVVATAMEKAVGRERGLL